MTPLRAGFFCAHYQGDAMVQKVITNIQLWTVQGKVAWVFEYADAPQESFSLHLGIAKQFAQGIQDLITVLEQPTAQNAVGLAEQVVVRLV
jgi:hypothetical protein